ncbi:EF-hand domain-containing protein [Novosphingobium flavum]|uniref:EF-hand domain-containing protein n=1 Tax=Novosphingobium flavum TaxID=1778672 RepID=A0A7X1KN71_9SPHN|nr:EF-hand domain-containing protein [Novosphingobium flavum]MBC2667123.1 EF-hand domain-containing protein [Novosphingobium flavum]
MKKNFACAIVLLALAGTPLSAKAPIPAPDFAADFKAVDTDHDGKLSWAEFLAGRKEREGRKHGEDARKPSYRWTLHYVQRFSQMDLDDDEVLTLDEYSRGRLLNEDNDGAMRYVQPNPPLPKAVVVVKERLPMVHPEITPAPKTHKSDFAQSDINHDGKLTWAEFLAGREKREGEDHGEEARNPTYKWIRHYVERFQAMDFDDNEVLSLNEFIRGRLLNTYNDNTLRFIQPKPYAKKPSS